MQHDFLKFHRGNSAWLEIIFIRNAANITATLGPGHFDLLERYNKHMPITCQDTKSTDTQSIRIYDSVIIIPNGNNFSNTITLMNLLFTAGVAKSLQLFKRGEVF
jgi:hypothetical protein